MDGGCARRRRFARGTIWCWSRKLTPAQAPAPPTLVAMRVTEAETAPAMEIVLTIGNRLQSFVVALDRFRILQVNVGHHRPRRASRNLAQEQEGRMLTFGLRRPVVLHPD